VSRFERGTWKDATEEWNFPGKQARQLYFDTSGALRVATENSVVYLPRGQNHFVDTGNTVEEQLESTMERADRAIAEGRSALYGLRLSTTLTNDLAEALNAAGNELSNDHDARRHSDLGFRLFRQKGDGK
jgi:hypothetical protein